TSPLLDKIEFVFEPATGFFELIVGLLNTTHRAAICIHKIYILSKICTVFVGILQVNKKPPANLAGGLEGTVA
ncbi:MAG TPA: hypothetical protein VEC93_20600, partial [Anaerolineae bacterium]|nr:hypothetical protein [Anaerolineae bacterium]